MQPPNSTQRAQCRARLRTLPSSNDSPLPRRLVPLLEDASREEKCHPAKAHTQQRTRSDSMTSASSELSDKNLNGDDDSFNSSWSDDGDKRHNNPLDNKVDNHTENVTTTSEGSSAQSLKEKMESLKFKFNLCQESAEGDDWVGCDTENVKIYDNSEHFQEGVSDSFKTPFECFQKCGGLCTTLVAKMPPGMNQYYHTKVKLRSA